MFKKLGRALSSKNRTKVRLDVGIKSIAGLPSSAGAARVVWARDSKVQMTKLASVSDGKTSWNEELSIIATLDKNAKGYYEPKAYDFRIQVPDGDQRNVTLGKAVVDMSLYADARNQTVALPITLPGGNQAVLTITITASAVKGLIGDDAASVISGVSGLSGSPSGLEQDQDLAGFGEEKRNVSENALSSLSTIPESMATSMGAGSPGEVSRNTSTQLADEGDADAPEAVVGGAATIGGGVAAAVALDSSPTSSAVVLPKEVPVAAPVPPIVEKKESIPSVMKSEPRPIAASLPPSAVTAATAPAATSAVSKDTEKEEPEQTQVPMDVQEPKQEETVEEMQLEEEEEEGEEQYYDEEGGSAAGSYQYEEGEEEEEEGYYHEVDIDDLEARLATAEAAAAEAETVAEEAIQMLEAERAERRQSEAAVTQLQRDLEWANKKAAKERAEWEGRMKDSFKKMEGTVLLAERVQREKAELGDRLAALTAEKKDLEAMLDRDAMEKRVIVAAAAAKTTAEAQAAIEIASLRKKVREMEEYVEEADAKALKAQGKATALAAQLAGAQGNTSADSWEEVRAADERADALSLELQYSKAECRSLEAEVKAAKEEADRATTAARREAEFHGARASDLARQLETTMAAAAAAERTVSQSQGRIVLLEDALERSNLQAAELRQRLVAAQVGAGAVAVGAVGAAAAGARSNSNINSSSAAHNELELAMQQVREVQDAAEGRAAQLAATSRELMASQEALSAAQSELHSARQDLADMQRIVAARDDEVRQLRDQLRAKEAQSVELKQLQRDMAGLLAGGAPRLSPRRVQNLNNVNLSGNTGAVGEGTTSRPSSSGAGQAINSSSMHQSEELEIAHQKLAEAEALARNAALQTADLIQQLASSQSERQEAMTKIGEMREELARLRSSAEGDHVRKIEALERELLVSRNRAEVNNLFREEHERIASDLIATKLAWAEGQEQLLVLKRSLIKSQERSMGFAAKLTKLETKLYRRLTNVGKRLSGSATDEISPVTVDEGNGSGSRTGSRPSSGASNRPSRKNSKEKVDKGEKGEKSSSGRKSRNKK